jgi:hypothetical protein
VRAKKLQRARQELRSFVEAAAKIQEYIRDIPAVTAGVTAFSLLVSITYNLFYFLGVTPSAKALGPGSLLSLLTLSDHLLFTIEWLLMVSSWGAASCGSEPLISACRLPGDLACRYRGPRRGRRG